MEEVKVPGPCPRCSVSILAVVTKYSRAPTRGWLMDHLPGKVEVALGKHLLAGAPPGDGEKQSELASRAVSLPSSALDSGGTN